MKPGWHICTVCNYIYEEALEKNGVKAGERVDFHSLPESWKCPGCNSAKTMYLNCTCAELPKNAESAQKAH